MLEKHSAVEMEKRNSLTDYSDVAIYEALRFIILWLLLTCAPPHQQNKGRSLLYFEVLKKQFTNLIYPISAPVH